MSTFNGLVAEFPDIRIDFFRTQPDARPPLACFLSHIHSDHLAGLESLRSPFVYCSAATREILLRLERSQCRLNYAKGILEARQQTYKHLKNILKPLPLDTPTCLELQPGRQIRVTPLDANHCPGAVMFLIEGDSKAILYTGDIRSEPWFVNTIARNPNVIEYTFGIKRLDKIYLDTSFTSDVSFQTKADGIAELLRKVSKYPDDTVFHFQAWTYGYEDVWIALSRALNSRIHVDDYKKRVYESLKVLPSEDNSFNSTVYLSPEAPALVGYSCGNDYKPGCLTSNKNVRIHSCEKGNMCAVAQAPNVVRIQPVIAHLPNGADLAEVGVGGGGDDLERDAEIDLLTQDLQALLKCTQASESLTPEVQATIAKFLTDVSKRRQILSLDMDQSSQDPFAAIEKVIEAIVKKSSATGTSTSVARNQRSEDQQLPRTITFPYSRHSSYPELCGFVNAWKPKDVWPCTVDEEDWLKEDISIASLFGQYCSGSMFDFDVLLQSVREAKAELEPQRAASTQMTDSQHRLDSSPMGLPEHPEVWLQSSPAHEHDQQGSNPHPNPTQFISLLPNTQAPIPTYDVEMSSPPPETTQLSPVIGLANDSQPTPLAASQGTKRQYDEYFDPNDAPLEEDDPGESQQTERSFVSTLSMRHSLQRREAYYEMLHGSGGDGWSGFGLISTDGGHTVSEKEL